MSKKIVVSEHMVERFLELLSPFSLYIVEKYKQQYFFTFSSEAETEYAENINFKLIYKLI